ncbi:hypothetical protein DPMN_187786 [Dreissena polymorpha]|uniref:Uncharacterized protein n=1 Tax=Dreissena polymorpha TaxID=45954 RepID=A0A9D4DRR2_DREPO|nr:hypothetical protein DPMN_187786 [Dreissena polymorpha]
MFQTRLLNLQFKEAILASRSDLGTSGNLAIVMQPSDIWRRAAGNQALKFRGGPFCRLLIVKPSQKFRRDIPLVFVIC